MKEREPDFSRTSRKRRRSKSNNILNALIGLVVVLIIITASIIFTGNKGEEQAEPEEDALTDSGQEETEEQQDTDLVLEDQADEEEAETPTVESDRSETAQPPADSTQGQNNGSTSQREETTLKPAEKEEKADEGGKVTYAKPDDPVIAETIVNSSWKPIGTTQTGDHVSQYDGESVDWQEKKQAIAYSTGIPEESLIYWKIKNGGSPQKSVGIVSTKDKSEKYQVHLEWVDGEGWKPVQMDVLNTLEFEY
ncbi:YrrS family protein [Sporosarcina sp. FSL W7-1349]|uniref:YrrS family protein n=1 Tax=Sporosarcina sp. FSL W7-1349 TaxID=2921561 RepID=UPI0030FC40DF